MLHINKFKFGLKENVIEISKDHHTHFPNSLLSVTSGKKSKKSISFASPIKWNYVNNSKQKNRNKI